MCRGRTTIPSKSERHMKFRACRPSPAHALKFHAVPSETAHGTFAILLHSNTAPHLPLQYAILPDKWGAVLSKLGCSPILLTVPLSGNGEREVPLLVCLQARPYSCSQLCQTFCTSSLSSRNSRSFSMFLMSSSLVSMDFSELFRRLCRTRTNFYPGCMSQQNYTAKSQLVKRKKRSRREAAPN